jgi:rhodanese-related sulfurtransferase
MDYEITPEEVKGKLDAGESFTLLDVREPWEFQTARIEDAKLIPMGDVPSRAHQELDPENHIVVLCHHGVRSMNVTVWLRQQGFEKVQSMRGGIAAWSRRVDAKVAMY